MLRNLIVVTTILLLTACFHNPVSNHSGATATLGDSNNRLSNSKVEYFVVNAVDGNTIENSIWRGRKASTGKTNRRQPIIEIERKVPANKEMQVEIFASIIYALGLRSAWNDTRDIGGTVTFTPVANRHYVVNGALGEGYRAVWIEDAETGDIVSNKVEVLGSEPRNS